MSAHASPPATSSLRGRWLLLARMVWVAISALAIILFSIPSSFEHYRSVCTAASDVCSERRRSAYTRRRASVTGYGPVGTLLCTL